MASWSHGGGGGGGGGGLHHKVSLCVIYMAEGM